MRIPSILFFATAIIVFFQMIAGALLVFSFIGFEAHMYAGFVTGIFALVTAVAAFMAKPRYNAFRYTSLVLLVLLVLQGGLGFVASSDSIVVVHFVNAMVLYGVAIAGTFYAYRWNKMPLQ